MNVKWYFPMALWGLVVVPLLALLAWWRGGAAGGRLRELVAERLMGRLVSGVGSQVLRLGLLLAGVAFAVLAWARPQWGEVKEERSGFGRDVIVAVDVSRSMQANDLPPSRLKRAKLAAEDLVRQLPGDRVGLVAFAGSSFLQAPVTSDHSAILAAIQELDTELIPLPGTNIADALRVAVEAFEQSEGGQRAVVLISDGEDLEEEGIQKAKELAGRVRIFAVGVGTPEGAVLSVPSPRGGMEYIRDAQGNVVSSKLDESRLRELAAAGGGFYLRLQSGPAEMRKIVQDGIMKMDEHEVKQEGRVRAQERYQWPLGAAVVLVGLGLLMGEGGRRRMARVGCWVGWVGWASLALWLMGGAGRVEAAALNSGLAPYQAGDYAGSMEAYRQELAGKPRSPERAYNLGTAAYKNKKWVEAMEAFGSALASSNPALRSRAEYNFANTLVQQAMQGRRGMDTRALEQAIEHYNAALKEDPALEDAEYNREVVRKLLEKKQQEQQKQQQGEGGEKNPQDSQQESRDSKDQKDSKEQKEGDKSQSGKDGKPENSEGQDPSKSEESKKSGQESKGEQSQQGKSPGQPGGDSRTAQNEGGQPPQNEPRPEPAGESKPRGELKNDPEAVDPKAVERERARQQQSAMQAGGDGKITRAQAEALMEALRSEDRRVHLWAPDAKQQHKDAKAREGRSW